MRSILSAPIRWPLTA